MNHIYVLHIVDILAISIVLNILVQTERGMDQGRNPVDLEQL
jgi:hypothetical protein